jgi:hypothetical protein
MRASDVCINDMVQLYGRWEKVEQVLHGPCGGDIRIVAGVRVNYFDVSDELTVRLLYSGAQL